VTYVGDQRTCAGAVPGSHNLASNYSIEGRVVPENSSPSRQKDRAPICGSRAPQSVAQQRRAVRIERAELLRKHCDDGPHELRQCVIRVHDLMSRDRNKALCPLSRLSGRIESLFDSPSVKLAKEEKRSQWPLQFGRNPAEKRR
jgi:hypothetical protein